MLLKKEDFWKRLERGIIDPVYMFYGQDEFLIREAVDRIVSAFLGPDKNRFQYQNLYGDDVCIDELIEHASTIPFGKSNRVISYQITGRLKAVDKERLISYADHPTKGTLLILTCGEMDFNASILKQFKEGTVMVRFYPLFKNQIPEWIKKHASQLGIKISNGAALLLEELIGSDLALLSNEIQKMALYLRPRKTIDIKDVEEAVGNIRIFSIFELTKSLGEKKAGESLRILRQLLDSGQAPVGVIALIANHFLRLLDIQALMRQRKTPTEIARKTRIPQIFLKEYLDQANIFDSNEIRTIFKHLLESDLQLKSSAVSQDIILESLIFSICSPTSLIAYS